MEGSRVSHESLESLNRVPAAAAGSPVEDKKLGRAETSDATVLPALAHPSLRH